MLSLSLHDLLGRQIQDFAVPLLPRYTYGADLTRRVRGEAVPDTLDADIWGPRTDYVDSVSGRPLKCYCVGTVRRLEGGSYLVRF